MLNNNIKLAIVPPPTSDATASKKYNKPKEINAPKMNAIITLSVRIDENNPMAAYVEIKKNKPIKEPATIPLSIFPGGFPRL